MGIPHLGILITSVEGIGAIGNHVLGIVVGLLIIPIVEVGTGEECLDRPAIDMPRARSLGRGERIAFECLEEVGEDLLIGLLEGRALEGTGRVVTDEVEGHT